MGWDSRLVYTPDFLQNVYAVFAENRERERSLRRVYHGLFHADWKKIACVGYTKLDLHKSMERKDTRFEKTVLWLPRWTTRELLEPSTFFQYKDQLLRYFQERPQFRLICRPHPLMFTNFISTGEMTEKEAADFKRLFSGTDNLFLDESGDHIPSFAEADIFLSDTSSLLVEEFATGRPVIFCGSMKHFDRRAKSWAGQMYHASGWKGLEVLLQKLLKGDDPGGMERRQRAKKLLSLDGKCGERMIAFIKKDYFNGTPEKEMNV